MQMHLGRRQIQLHPHVRVREARLSLDSPPAFRFGVRIAVDCSTLTGERRRGSCTRGHSE